MKTALAYKQFLSKPNCKPIRLLHNHVNTNPINTHKSEQNETKSGFPGS